MSLIRADARSLPLRDGCVDCVVTSPPYWGLRNYGTTSQIGLEKTPEAFVSELVTAFRDVRRVLKDEGVLWLNLGDSYATGGGAVGLCPGGGDQGERFLRQGHINTQPNRMKLDGLKSKDLIGIPWRVAFALQADGWYLRSDIIWAKPNPMPESVTDRPTKSHEYLFLLSKQEKYWYDAAAIAEPVSVAMLQQVDEGYEGLGLKDYKAAGVQNPSSVKARIIEGARRKNEQTGDRRKVGFNARWDERERHDRAITLTRNRRTVWTIPTMPYAGAHFATMPEKLVEPCILAGCPMGGLVLDPFVGSGTVVSVAQRLGRRGVGVDLNYQDLAKVRTAQRGLRFAHE